MKNKENKCPKCGFKFETQIAPGLKGNCPKCLAGFLMCDDETKLLREEDKIELEKAGFIKPGSKIKDMEIIEFLGRGGMGFVYKAKQSNLDREVALKILHPELASSDEFTSRFTREAKALAALNHPNIVQVYDYGHEENHYYLVMEFIDGTDLRQILNTQKIEPETALSYVPQICDALEYAHSQKVIHRDIKPENILIDKKGNLKIADFGLAKMTFGDDIEYTHMTKAGSVMGTPHYMAPEQMKETASVDHRADIYSLGVVFYEMLTGDLPLGSFPVPSESVKVNVSLDKVVLKALEQNPERRYQHVSEISEDVRDSKVSSEAVNSTVDHKKKFKLCNIALTGAFCLPLGIPIIVQIYQEMFYTAYEDDMLLRIFDVGFYSYFLLPLGLIAAILTTVFGFLSVKRIANSDGKLSGLKLAKFEAAFYPFALLNLFVFIVIPKITSLSERGFSIWVAIAYILAAGFLNFGFLLKYGDSVVNTAKSKMRFFYIVIAFMISVGSATVWIAAEKNDARTAFTELDNLLAIRKWKVGMNPLDPLIKLKKNYFGVPFLKALAKRYDNFIYKQNPKIILLYDTFGNKYSSRNSKVLYIDKSYIDENGIKSDLGSTITIPNQAELKSLKIDGQSLILDYSFPNYYATATGRNDLSKRAKENHEELKRLFQIEPNQTYRLQIDLDKIIEGKGFDPINSWKNGTLVNP